uniref:Basic tail secreted protein n=1 Tax=Rhipicephalus appendiculatus TaxID=34631 RepID=A0A131YSC9_RHIAP
MGPVVSIRSAILAATILQAVFIGLSRPTATSELTTTAEPNRTVEMCNVTCHTANKSSCPGDCFCVTLNNNSVGHCMSITAEDDYYIGGPTETLEDSTTVPPITNNNESLLTTTIKRAKC